MKLSSRQQFLLFVSAITIGIIKIRVIGLTSYTNLSSTPTLVSGKTTGPQKHDNKPTTIAYAASFIKCDIDNFGTSSLIDAGLVLRHSIHKISSRNPSSGSKYDYKMYALVHGTDAITCKDMIESLGFEVIVVDPPFQVKDIQDDYVRAEIHRAWCCGHEEFIKLHAYNLTEELFVHVDLDFVFQKPMDHLFDAMLYDKESMEGITARKKIEQELQLPLESNSTLPDDIRGFYTRDWAQVAPNKGWKSGYQAGFLAAKRDPTMIPEVSKMVLTTNYTDGYSRFNGWGNLGYSRYIVGAMGMQGVMAYVYDVLRPDTMVELNMCLHNHLGMDSRYNYGGPWYRAGTDTEGKCRDDRRGLDTCDQCKYTPLESIYSIHYSPCGKPWYCVTEGHKRQKGKHIDSGTCDIDHCLELQSLWHKTRLDIEIKLMSRRDNKTAVEQLVNGNFREEVFFGHCNGENDYINLLEFSDIVGELTKNFYK